MQVRTPAVAGVFYADKREDLARQIEGCFLGDFGPQQLPPSGSSEGVIGAICPHAGYAYSGPVAAQSYFAMSNEQHGLAIIIGPNHWGIGEDVATTGDCIWQTPLGGARVDREAASDLVACSDLIGTDSFSHTRDHSLEVQVPMLQFISEDTSILPVIMNSQDIRTATEVGEAVAKVAAKNRDRNPVVIGSSDLTHYEDNDSAHSQDAALLKPVGSLDVEEFYGVLAEKKVSACGYGAMASTMTACKRLGATTGRLLQYATSGDVAGDKSSVVGYGSVAFS